jgi:hypothetical protein
LVEEMENLPLLAVSMPPDSDIASALAFLDAEAEKGNIAIEESAVRYK